MKSLKFYIEIGLLTASCSVLTIATKPAIAQNLTTQSSGDPVSTKAIDLLSSKQQVNFINNPSTNYQLAQRELDLEKFCQSYPLNSRCTQTDPSNSSPIPVPTEPPTPPEGSQDEGEDVSQDPPKSGWAIVPEISSLGLGGHVVRKITPQFNARVGVNAFGLGLDNLIDTDVDYEADLNLFNVSTLLDLHPFSGSGFRVSGGLVFGDNNVEATADISDEVAEEVGEVEFEGQTFDLRDFDTSGIATVDADVDLTNSVSPYLGIGGGNAVADGKGLGFWWNLGVVFSGTPDVEVTTSLSDQVPEEFRDEAQAAADQESENEEEDIEDELINIYPVLSLGLSYQF
jgi:opacity protein-like surface antigen